MRVRAHEQTTARTDQLLAAMKDTLDRIIKNYPPYPIDDPERAKFLRSFNGLKHEIEQLTVPPDSIWFGTSPRENMPSAETVPALLPGSPDPGISRSAIPPLGEGATNVEMQDVIKQIEQAITSASAEAAPVSDFAAAGAEQDKIAVLATIAGEDLNLTVPGETAAETTSLRARRELAGAVGGSITEAQQQLLALAG